MTADAGAPDDASGDGSAPDVADDADARRTGLQSERVAVVVAVVGALALVVDLGLPAPALVAVAGLGTALGLRYVAAERDLIAVGARVVGAVGALVGVAGAFAAAAAVGAGSAYATFAVCVGAWIGTVGTVAAVTGDGLRSRLHSIAATAGVAGVVGVVGVAAGVPGTLGSGDASVVTTGLGVAIRGAVLGGTPESGLPLLVLLVGLLCGALVALLSFTPQHVLLSPRSSYGAAALDDLTETLLKGCIAAVVTALLLFGFDLGPPLIGVLGILEAALRAVLVLGIVLASLAAVAGAFLPRWLGDEDRSVRGAALTVVGGAVAAVGLLALAGAFAIAAPYAGAPAVSGAVAAIVRTAVAAGLLGYPIVRVAEFVRAVFGVSLPESHLVASGALLVGAVGAAVAGGAVSVVLGVAAALLLWDALTYRTELRDEVPGIDASTVEESHLGAATGLVVGGAVAAGALYGVTVLVGPALDGQPLFVVVVGATLLAVVGVIFSRSRPA